LIFLVDISAVRSFSSIKHLRVLFCDNLYDLKVILDIFKQPFRREKSSLAFLSTERSMTFSPVFGGKRARLQGSSFPVIGIQ
ncbi:hypothetical protein L9F63_009225, partial [Diploptera punctata]